MIAKAAVSEITRTRWWLQDGWKEKSTPKEQIEFSNGSRDVTVYNYGRVLNEQEIVIFQKIFGIFAGIGGGINYDYFRYLLIEDRQPIYDKTGKPQNGVARADLKIITLFPNAFQLRSSEFTGQASHLEWSLAHEESHGFEDVMLDSGLLIDEWKKTGNWDYGEARDLAGGGVTHWNTTYPERCLSERGRADPQEDLAECGAGRIFVPELVDRQKLQFLERNLPMDRGKQNPWRARILKASDIQLPQLPDEFVIRAIPKRAFLVTQRREAV